MPVELGARLAFFSGCVKVGFCGERRTGIDLFRLYRPQSPGWDRGEARAHFGLPKAAGFSPGWTQGDPFAAGTPKGC